MYKNDASGDYEHDFRVDGMPRYRACYGAKKADAERLHQIAVAVFKSRDPELVHALKRRGAAGVTLEQYAQLRERGRPFSDALATVAAVKPWPAVGDAVARYVTAFEDNENRCRGWWFGHPEYAWTCQCCGFGDGNGHLAARLESPLSTDVLPF
jgi:hypothetical protein